MGRGGRSEKGSRSKLGSRDVSKSKEPPEFLSSSGITGAKFISLYDVLAECSPSFGNQRILKFRIVAVRDQKLRSRLS